MTAIAIDVGGTSVKIGIRKSCEHGWTVYRTDASTESRIFGDPNGMGEQLAQFLQSHTNEPITVVTCSIAGVIDSQNGVVQHSHALNRRCRAGETYDDFKFVKVLEQCIPTARSQVRILNDGAAYAFAMWRSGAELPLLATAFGTGVATAVADTAGPGRVKIYTTETWGSEKIWQPEGHTEVWKACCKEAFDTIGADRFEERVGQCIQEALLPKYWKTFVWQPRSIGVAGGHSGALHVEVISAQRIDTKERIPVTVWGPEDQLRQLFDGIITFRNEDVDFVRID